MIRAACRALIAAAEGFSDEPAILARARELGWRADGP